MVGDLEHATFSNITEQHKMLYQDTLGPWLKFIKLEIERQLLPEFEDRTDVYVEFNINEKLRGSFEQQAASLGVLVGRPIMTANEGRARLNLPQLDDESANELAPQQGGPAAVPPAESDEEAPAMTPSRGRGADTARLSRTTARGKTPGCGNSPAERPVALPSTRSLERELARDLAGLTPPMITGSRGSSTRKHSRVSNTKRTPRERHAMNRDCTSAAPRSTVGHRLAWLPIVAPALRRHRGRAVDEATRQAAIVQRKDPTPNPPRGGVAVIPVYGMIAPRMNALSDISGGTSFDVLGQQLAAAVDNPKVGTIVLDVDSPGGSVAGAPEFAAAVRAARVKKPIIAQAPFKMGSAAIGPRLGHEDLRRAPARRLDRHHTIQTTSAIAAEGVTRTYIAAGNRRRERSDAADRRDASVYRAPIDAAARTAFLGDIARAAASLVPCARSYGEGKTLTAEAAPPPIIDASTPEDSRPRADRRPSTRARRHRCHSPGAARRHGSGAPARGPPASVRACAARPVRGRHEYLADVQRPRHQEGRSVGPIDRADDRSRERQSRTDGRGDRERRREARRVSRAQSPHRSRTRGSQSARRDRADERGPAGRAEQLRDTGPPRTPIARAAVRRVVRVSRAHQGGVIAQARSRRRSNCRPRYWRAERERRPLLIPAAPASCRCSIDR
jgi:hypothetical protein